MAPFRHSRRPHRHSRRLTVIPAKAGIHTPAAAQPHSNPPTPPTVIPAQAGIQNPGGRAAFYDGKWNTNQPNNGASP